MLIEFVISVKVALVDGVDVGVVVRVVVSEVDGVVVGVGCCIVDSGTSDLRKLYDQISTCFGASPSAFSPAHRTMPDLVVQ